MAESVHDISSGGLLIALAEMSMGSDYGVKINKPKKMVDNLISNTDGVNLFSSLLK